MSQPYLSVLILGFRNFSQTTLPCLETLLPWSDDDRIEIILQDNGSDDDASILARAWCERHPKIQFLPGNQNLGFAGGMNWGASYARGEWLLLVNNDTLFPDKTLDALLSVLHNAPTEVAMVAPVTNAAGNAQRLWLPAMNHPDMMALGAQLHASPTGLLLPLYRCDFFCIAVRRNIWNALGGLDTDFGLGYYEDFDFSLRLRESGWQQVMTEDVFVLHVGSATFKASPQAKLLMKKNKALLKAKHPRAQFLHARLGNLAVLQSYEQLGVAEHPNVRLRRNYRLQALNEDAPRSFWKKWLWRRKTSPYLAATTT